MIWILFVACLLVAGGVGGLVHSTWMEARHDCLPHDADRCRWGVGGND